MFLGHGVFDMVYGVCGMVYGVCGMFLWCMLYGLECMLYAVWCMGEVLGFRRRVSRAGESSTDINSLVFGFMIHDYCLWLGNDGLWCVVYGLWFLLNDDVLMNQCSWARNRVEGLPGGG